MKINWKQLKQTPTDNIRHETKEIYYCHKPADKLHTEQILVIDKQSLSGFALYASGNNKSGWCMPFETIIHLSEL